MNNGELRAKDVVLVLVSNTTMRRLARIYASIPRTTDVLSFRLADETPASLRARRAPFRHSWASIFDRLPPSKYLSRPPKAAEDGEAGDAGRENVLDAAIAGAATAAAAGDASMVMEEPPAMPSEAGTVVLAPDYCDRIAGRRNIASWHYRLLAMTHGLAHLAGHDHHTARDTRTMKLAEQHAISTLRANTALYAEGEGEVSIDDNGGTHLHWPGSYIP